MRLINHNTSCAAQMLNHEKRKKLALTVIKNKETITKVANHHNVSRKFIHGLKDKAMVGINKSFEPQVEDKERVLFYFPVTKSWLNQFILCLLLHCRSSFRGVIKVLDDAFNYSISIGSIHNLTGEAKQQAKAINEKQDLTGVTLGANDELFHQNKPILIGVDIRSLYCYLCSREQHRDGGTWAIHLWDLKKQGFNPERVFADNGDGLRAGHKLALPNIPCDADHFHIIKKLNEMRQYFKNRLKSAITYLKEIELKMKKAKLCGKSHKYAKKLGLAREHQQQMQYLSGTINTLVSWMEHDVLEKAGPNPTERYELFDFVLGELNKLAKIHPHRISDACTSLKSQCNLLLAFTEVLDNKFKNIALQYKCSIQDIWKMCQLQRCQRKGDKYAIRSMLLWQKHGESFYEVENAVISAMNSTERTSSMVENINGRIRPYLKLRHEIGSDYLELLRFYLNHTPFMRSASNRGNTSPAELLSGKSHQNWLEMLGYQRFKRAA